MFIVCSIRGEEKKERIFNRTSHTALSRRGRGRKREKILM